MGEFFRLSCYFAALFLLISTPALLVTGPVMPGYGLSWAASNAALAIFILVIRPKSLGYRLITFSIVTILAILNVALTASFLLQGGAFNTAFFSHLDASTLSIAWATDTSRLSAALAYTLIVPVVAMVFMGAWTNRKAQLELTYFSPVLLAVAIIANYPVQAIILHHTLQYKSSERMLEEIQRLHAERPRISQSREDKKNLVLIYLESLEQNYLDEAIFPNLTPNLDEIMSRAVLFDNMHQYPGTSWTIAGIVSSQCGIPLLSTRNGNKIFSDINDPFIHIDCLAEYLESDGYHTVFLGGATLKFAGKGRFLQDNGYSLTLGIDELPKATRHAWGMFDDDLFKHGAELFDVLAEGSSPFLLTMLTLDTHHPDGTPSPSCAPYGDGTQTMLSAVHCSDFLLNKFIDHISNSSASRDTVVALVSDHLLINGAPVDSLSQKQRKLTFMLVGSTLPHRRSSGPATHFDIAPTLLDAIGHPEIIFPFGHSLLRNKEGRAFERKLSADDFNGFKIETLLENLAPE